MFPTPKALVEYEGNWNATPPEYPSLDDESYIIDLLMECLDIP